jgi:hypothetical protein
MTQSTFQTPSSPDSSRTRARARAEELRTEEDTAFDGGEEARQRAEQARLEEKDPPRVEASHPVNTLGTSYLGDGSTEEAWQNWRQIQANFVDDPRHAVSDAHGLVGELINTIVRSFEGERTQLEQRWSSGEDVSTEELRTCLQRYRDFFGRLLSKVGDEKA